MPYKNLVGLACANRAEVFKRFRDFVCARNGSYDYTLTGIGWTLYDSSYAVDEHTISTNDWFVVYSPGESGAEDLYFRCTFITNYIKVEGFLYWNAATNAGVQQYSTGSNWYIADADVPILWVYGSLDAIFALSRQNSTSANVYPVFFGKSVNTLYDDTVAVSAASITAGSNVVIDVGTVPASWQVGMKLFIRDQTQVNLTAAAITALTVSTVTITVAQSYAAGAKLSADLSYYCSSGNTVGYGTTFLMLHNGTKSQIISPVTVGSSQTPIMGGNPDTLYGEYIAVPVAHYNATYGYMGEVDGVFMRAAGATNYSVYQDVLGNNYRAFTVQSAVPLAVLEV